MSLVHGLAFWLYTREKGDFDQQTCEISSNCFWVSMSALEAALGERMEKLAEAKSKKQKAQVRLLVDPNITVTALVAIFTAFVHFKGCSCLESLVEPPPEGPVSFGWHTNPAPAWLTKASGLLYDLLSVAKNSKLASTKVVKALHVMWQNRDLTLKVNQHTKPGDCIDKIDFMVRVLMNQLRVLKTNSSLKGEGVEVSFSRRSMQA